MRKRIFSIAVCLCLPFAAAAQASYEAIHRDAAQKWAEFLGMADSCSGRARGAEIRVEAEKAAAILRPGLMAWVSGARSTEADLLTANWNAHYAVARLKPNCLGADMLEQRWRDLMHRALEGIGG